MALQTSEVARKFTLVKSKGKSIQLEDPGHGMSALQVAKFYTGQHPELTNAEIEGPEVDRATNTISYKFVQQVGTKG
jgi:PRTRC genetic system protein C